MYFSLTTVFIPHSWQVTSDCKETLLQYDHIIHTPSPGKTAICVASLWEQPARRWGDEEEEERWRLWRRRRRIWDVVPTGAPRCPENRCCSAAASERAAKKQYGRRSTGSCPQRHPADTRQTPGRLLITKSGPAARRWLRPTCPLAQGRRVRSWRDHRRGLRRIDNDERD